MSHLMKLFLLAGLISNITTMPRPDAFDDEGEMSVPRSPKIQGPPMQQIPYTSLDKVDNLQCIIEGSPTPTVVWSKDGHEIGDSEKENLYQTIYNVTNGKAELRFLELAKREQKHITGNFTCIAANFLGRVQKLFVLEWIKESVPTSASTHVSSTPITEGNSKNKNATKDLTSSTPPPEMSKTVRTSQPTIDRANVTSLLAASASPTLNLSKANAITERTMTTSKKQLNV